MRCPARRWCCGAPRRASPAAGRGLRGALPFLGPAFVAAVAYVDPGNFATNMAGGADVRLPAAVGHRHGEPDGDAHPVDEARSSASRAGSTCRRPAAPASAVPVVIGLWAQAEVIAMATDLAEFLGAALGLKLLFGVPLFLAGVLTGIASGSRSSRCRRTASGGSRRVIASLCRRDRDRLCRAGRARGSGRPADVGTGPHPRLRGDGEPAAGRRHPRRDGDAARRSTCTRR